jgi:hypothetical protein
LQKNKRSNGRKHVKYKGKKTGDDDFKKSLNDITNVIKEMTEERKMMKKIEMEERRQSRRY